uniref:Uncharacterized protein n=1 Tax=Megaselia scalaris TaxID=36166 RepID=T1GKK9_MEGSC
MFLFGFIIWNLYNSKLSSYLTTPSLGKHLKTVEEIREANLTLWSDIYRKIQRNFTVYLKKFYPKIYDYEQVTFKGQFNYRIEKPEFYKHLYEFDTSQGYLINEMKWNFISHSQKLLNRKLFSFSDVCPRYAFLYPFNLRNGHKFLQEILTSFTLKVIEAGLDLAWEEMSNKSFEILGFKYFETVWWILIVGIILSILTFEINAPTEDDTDEVKYWFYEQLDKA